MKISYFLKAVLFKLKLILEKIRGLDISSISDADSLGLDPKLVFRSSPSGNKYLDNCLQALKISSNDSILDIGSGKGGAMITMSKFPFKFIHGIEIASSISEVANQNFNRLGLKQVKSYNYKAEEFDEYEKYNYFYFYNPFPEEIMDVVINRITDSYQKSRRKITVIYNNPTCGNIIIGSRMFKAVCEFPNEWGQGILIYTNDQ